MSSTGVRYVTLVRTPARILLLFAGSAAQARNGTIVGQVVQATGPAASVKPWGAPPARDVLPRTEIR